MQSEDVEPRRIYHQAVTQDNGKNRIVFDVYDDRSFYVYIETTSGELRQMCVTGDVEFLMHVRNAANKTLEHVLGTRR